MTIMERKVQILEGGQEDRTSMIWVLQNYESVPGKCLGLKGQNLIIISALITREAIKSKNLRSLYFYFIYLFFLAAVCGILDPNQVWNLGPSSENGES